MEVIRQVRLQAAYTAIFAVLMLTIAPLISHLIEKKDTQGFTLSVCSISKASDSIRINGKLPFPPAEPGDRHDQCPYCFAGSTSFAILPNDATLFMTVFNAMVFPILFYQSSSKLFAWTANPPRGPPTVS